MKEELEALESSFDNIALELLSRLDEWGTLSGDYYTLLDKIQTAIKEKYSEEKFENFQ